MGRKRVVKIKFKKLYDVKIKLLKNIIKNDEIDDRIMNHISYSDKKILDVHCKTGLMTIKIAKERPYAEVIGLAQHHYLPIAKRRKRQHFVKNIEFMHLSNLTIHEKYFDIITLFFVLNELEVDRIKQLLLKIKSILKENKKLLIVDFTKGKNRITNFVLKVYHLIFGHKNMNKFLSINLCELLKHLGYHNITKEEYNGFKLISSFNPG